MVTFNILLIAILLIAFLLVIVVMVQQPKGGGLSSTFGGNAQVVGGVQNTTNFLDKSTWTLGALMLVFILLANIVVKHQGATNVNDSILLDGNNTPSAPAPAKLPTPPTK